MVGTVAHHCQVCGTITTFKISDDGFFNCELCCSQADDIVDTGVDEEQVFNLYGPNCSRGPASNNAIAPEPVSQIKLSESQFLDLPNVNLGDAGDTLGDGYEPSSPRDIELSQKTYTYEQYYTEIRLRYLAGLQIMIQLQCQVLVEEYNVCPLIIGLIGPLWLRFLSSTEIMSGDWADRAVHDSETQNEVEVEEYQPSATQDEEPVNIYGKRLVLVWYRSLKKAVPISTTLAFSFLICHLTREAIMPSDIVKWALEGKIPYFSAFLEIGKKLGPGSGACSFRDSFMFRPVQSISLQNLESMAANIARRISLELPPINFYAVASRYCKQLYLPERVLRIACQICEWAMPPELYLSASESRIPTRVCVMSVLIVAIRLLFDINGYGLWESIVSDPHSPLWSKNEGGSRNSNIDALSLIIVEFLKILKEKYIKSDNTPDCHLSLDTYLQYCKGDVFSGLWPSRDDVGEENLLMEFRGVYNDKSGKRLEEDGLEGINESMDNMSDHCAQTDSPDDENLCITDNFTFSVWGEDSGDGFQGWSKSLEQKVATLLKSDMNENGFQYIPPRVNIKRRNYLHYARRKHERYVYAVHADYYIILRSFSMAAQVDPRVMHNEVLRLERRLCWLEKRMDKGDKENTEVVHETPSELQV